MSRDEGLDGSVRQAIRWIWRGLRTPPSSPSGLPERVWSEAVVHVGFVALLLSLATAALTASLLLLFGLLERFFEVWLATVICLPWIALATDRQGVPWAAFSASVGASASAGIAFACAKSDLGLATEAAVFGSIVGGLVGPLCRYRWTPIATSLAGAGGLAKKAGQGYVVLGLLALGTYVVLGFGRRAEVAPKDLGRAVVAGLSCLLFVMYVRSRRAADPVAQETKETWKRIAAPVAVLGAQAFLAYTAPAVFPGIARSYEPLLVLIVLGPVLVSISWMVHQKSSIMVAESATAAATALAFLLLAFTLVTGFLVIHSVPAALFRTYFTTSVLTGSFIAILSTALLWRCVGRSDGFDEEAGAEIS